MRKTLAALGLAVVLVIFAAVPAHAATVTKTITWWGYTISCEIVYTDANGNGWLDWRELGSITDIHCTVSRNQ